MFAPRSALLQGLHWSELGSFSNGHISCFTAPIYQFHTQKAPKVRLKISSLTYWVLKWWHYFTFFYLKLAKMVLSYFSPGWFRVPVCSFNKILVAFLNFQMFVYLVHLVGWGQVLLWCKLRVQVRFLVHLLWSVPLSRTGRGRQQRVHFLLILGCTWRLILIDTR